MSATSGSRCPTAACARSRGHDRRRAGRADRRRAWPRRARHPGERPDPGPRPPARGRRDASRSSPSATPRRSTCCATPPRTSWRPRCAELFPSAGSASARRSRTASTTTSRCDRPFTPEDLERIEAEMRKVVGGDYPFVREEVDRDEAQPAVRRRSAQARAIDELGADEIDHRLHRRPVRRPLPRSARARHRRGSSTSSCCTRAGAYWRGDEQRQMLQRIYGTAWFKKEELDAYLHRLEEAKQARPPQARARSSTCSCSTRSRRARAFWTERGTTHRTTRSTTTCASCSATAISEIKTPLLYNKGLWEISGHWGKYRENMFLVLDNETRRARLLAQADELPVAPPALPARRSTRYRELPLRYSTLRRAAPQRGRRARSAGSRACASSSRTTATSS